MSGLRGNAPLMYLEVEFWKDLKWHGTCYRHKPLPGGSDLPRYVLHVSTNEGFDEPRAAAAKIRERFPDLPDPLEGISETELQAGIAEAKKIAAQNAA